MRTAAILIAAVALTAGNGCHLFPMKGVVKDGAGTAGLPPESPSASARLELPPQKSAQACIATAELMEKSGKLDEAVGLYEKARHDDPTQTQVCRRLAVLHDSRGDFARADDEYKKAFALYPRDADLMNDYGYSFYTRGDWASAEQHFRQAVTVKPDHAKAWVNLGLACAQQGRRDDSLSAFDKAIPHDQALCNYAFVLAAQGQTAEAVAVYREALQLNPNQAVAAAAVAKLKPN